MADRRDRLPNNPPRRRAATALGTLLPGCARGLRRRRHPKSRPIVDYMRRYPGVTRAGCEPPSRQTVRIPRRPGPTASEVRGRPEFPRQALGAGVRFPLACGLGYRRPFSACAPGGGILTAARNCKLKRSAPPRYRFDPDAPTLALDDFLANRETDARTGYFASMQALEHAEHPVGVLRIDADSVVPHRKQPPRRVSLGRDMDVRNFRASVLDRIGNEVLEKL